MSCLVYRILESNLRVKFNILKILLNQNLSLPGTEQKKMEERKKKKRERERISREEKKKRKKLKWMI